MKINWDEGKLHLTISARTKVGIKVTLVYFIVKVAALLLSMATLFYQLNTIGIKEYGHWIYLSSVLGLNTVFDTIISVPSRREAAVHSNENGTMNPFSLEKISLFLRLSLLFTFSLAILIDLFIWQNSAIGSEAKTLCIFLVLINLFINAFHTFYIRILEGLGYFISALVIPLTGSLLLCLSSLICFRYDLGLTGVATSNVVGVLLSMVIGRLFLRKIGIKRRNSAKKKISKSPEFFALAIIAICIFVTNTSSVWFIHSFLDLNALTVYSLHGRFSFILSAITASLTPIIWQKVFEENPSKSSLRNVGSQVALASLILGIATIPFASWGISIISKRQADLDIFLYSFMIMQATVTAYQVTISSRFLNPKGLRVQASLNLGVMISTLLISYFLIGIVGVLTFPFAITISLLLFQVIPIHLMKASDK